MYNGLDKEKMILIYKTTKNIFLVIDGQDVEIPEGTILYKIPGDHMGTKVGVNYFSWGDETIRLDKDNDSLKKI